MDYESAPGRPVLLVDDSEEAARARALLEQHDIAYETERDEALAVQLRWNGIVYPGLFGVADFVMIVGALPLPGLRRSERPGGDGEDDQRLPGSPIPIR